MPSNPEASRLGELLENDDLPPLMRNTPLGNQIPHDAAHHLTRGADHVGDVLVSKAHTDLAPPVCLAGEVFKDMANPPHDIVERHIFHHLSEVANTLRDAAKEIHSDLRALQQRFFECIARHHHQFNRLQGDYRRRAAFAIDKRQLAKKVARSLNIEHGVFSPLVGHIYFDLSGANDIHSITDITLSDQHRISGERAQLAFAGDKLQLFPRQLNGRESGSVFYFLRNHETETIRFVSLTIANPSFMLPNHPSNNKHFRTIYFVRALQIGLLTAIIGVATLLIPPLAKLEHDIGLDWLMKLRGPLPAPSHVIVAAMDRESSDALGYPNLPRKWSRQRHADLVNTLHELGTPAIAFDVMFDESRSEEDDQAFAEAMRNSGRVILFEKLYTVNKAGIRMEQHIPPLPVLAEAAAATAPFALPKVPARVSRAWLLKEGAGDSVTLPVVMLYQYQQQHYPAFARLLAESLKKLGEPLPSWLSSPMGNPRDAATRVHHLFEQLPELAPQASKLLTTRRSSNVREALRSWLYTHTRPNSIVLNLYGPARSIHTVPYHKLLAPDDELRRELANAAVFVGFSEILQPEQKDGFYTAFTDDGGVDISGVELMATTFANILHREDINALGGMQQLLLLGLFGLTVGGILFLLPGLFAPVGATIAAFGWLQLALYLFGEYQLWLPITTPLLFQLPLGLMLALTAQYLQSHRHRQHLSTRFRQFLPDEVVDSAQHTLEKGELQDGKTTHIACLFTDMQGYTSLAEEQSPEEIHKALNQYFSLLYEPVYQRGGLVTDMAGDSMVAIWHKHDAGTDHLAACDAALHIQSILGDKKHPTRLGLHSGEAYVGTVGSDKHREYRAIGDAVNTASRIQAANKVLGTQILASGNIVQGFKHLHRRYLGSFQLKGKMRPVELFELLPQSRSQSKEQSALHRGFSAALQLWQEQHWEQAAEAFEKLVQQFADGPSKFYAQESWKRHTSRKSSPNTVVDLSDG